MKLSFGPWSTAINTGNNPQLSTLWKRRLAMLQNVHRSARDLSRRKIFALTLTGLAICLLPTAYGIPVSQALSKEQPAQAEKPDDSKKTEQAEAVYRKLTEVKKWQDASKLSKQLAKMGRFGLPVLLKGVEHDNKETRWWSFYQLQHEFPKEPKFVDAMIRLLKDKKGKEKFAKLRYSSVFTLGTWKIERAKDVLWDVYKNETDLRLTAAKSLAELGEKRVLRTLYHNLSHDKYMQRYQANLGMKALSEKDLNDLDLDYRWSEGAFVTGGIEFTGSLRPIVDAELKAKRYHAIAEFSKWLKKDHPELYEELDPNARAKNSRRQR